MFDSPDGITKVIYNVPTEEVVAAKRFALEADLAVDPERIELYRVKWILKITFGSTIYWIIVW